MLTLVCRDTQKNKDDSEIQLYYRTEKDIFYLLNYILGNGSEKAIICGASGFLTQQLSAESLSNEILFVQNFHRKTGGIRVRHQIITIDYCDLTPGMEIEQAHRIAGMMSQLYIYKGFQNVWSVMMFDNLIKISIVINTVSCYDGSKYHYNRHQVFNEEYRFLKAIYDKVVNSDDVYIDYRDLEFYPYSI